MRKSLLLSFISLFVLLLTVTSTQVKAQSESISLNEQKVIYQLPHPGMLPDHPFYFLKSWRDNFLDFITRDKIKKAERFLLNSDKHMSMAVNLANKGKHELAIKTLKEGEEYFLKIPTLLRDSKKQGVGPSDELIQKLYQSNAKHQEVITEVLKEVPQANVDQVTAVLEANKQAHKDIQNIK